jgi:hypothetical protein
MKKSKKSKFIKFCEKWQNFRGKENGPNEARK